MAISLNGAHLMPYLARWHDVENTLGYTMSVEDDLQVEEFKLVKARVESHEKRYFEMLIAAAGSLAATLGLADKVPSELLPLGLGFILVAIVHFAVRNRLLQFYASAYLLSHFDNRFSTVKYERMYADLSSAKAGRTSPGAVTCAFRVIRDPIAGIVISYVCISVYFGYQLVLSVNTLLYPMIPSIYVAVVSGFALQVLRSVIELHKISPVEIREKVARWHDEFVVASSPIPEMDIRPIHYSEPNPTDEA